MDRHFYLSSLPILAMRGVLILRDWIRAPLSFCCSDTGVGGATEACVYCWLPLVIECPGLTIPLKEACVRPVLPEMFRLLDSLVITSCNLLPVE